MAAYLRNAPPAYECDRAALPSLSHFRPAVPSPIPGTRRVCPRSRHAQPAAVYPQSIKDDRQHEYQQRQQLPVAGHPPTHLGIARFCQIYPTWCTHVRRFAVIANTSLLHPIASHVSRNRAGFFECLGCIEKERFKEFRRSEDERRATTRTKSRGDEPIGGPSGFFFFNGLSRSEISLDLVRGATSV